MFRKAFDWFIFSSFYISICAVLMLYQTYRLLLDGIPSPPLLGFVFFSTDCSYNFHWYLTDNSVNSSQRIDWTLHHKKLHLFLWMLGLGGSLVCFYLLRKYWLLIIVGAFLTFLYSAPKIPLPFFRDLKRIALGKTLFLTFVWVYATTLLPIFIAQGPWNAYDLFFSASRFFLIYSICILFDYRDRDDDQRSGIRSMITFLNEKGINVLFTVSLVLFGTSTCILYLYNRSIGLTLILLTPGILTAAFYPYSKKNFSDYWYYFVLDGLMMLSGILMLIVGI